MNGWHPASKLVLGVATVALPYLAWTALGDAPAAVSAPPALRAAADTAALPVLGPGPVRLAALPPVERFQAIVERPLFSPSRRPPFEDGVEETAQVEVEEPMDEVAAAPDFRLVGTIVQGGVLTALVHDPDQSELVRLSQGGEIAGWRVVELDNRTMTLERDAERLVLTMLE